MNDFYFWRILPCRRKCLLRSALPFTPSYEPNLFYLRLYFAFLLLSSPHLQKVVGRRLDDGGGALLDDAVQRVRRDGHRQRHLLRVLALVALVMLTLLLLALVVLSRVAVGGLVGVGGVLGAAVAAAVGRLDVRPLTAEGRERGAK